MIKHTQKKNKQVLILIGSKGAGKTYIGNLIEKKLSIPFISTEEIFLRLTGSTRVQLTGVLLKKGYTAVEKEIDIILKKKNKVIMESTGTFKYFKELLQRLRSKYTVKLIFIYAPLSLCLERLKKKNVTKHFKMSKEKIKEVYKISNALNFKYVLKINNIKESNDEIIGSIKKIL